MCLLTFYPSDVMPNLDALNTGTYLNNDGHGFAIVTGNRIIVRHGMNAERMVATFARMRRKYPHGPALFHSRMGTHGTVGKHNCHPFRMGGDRRTVVAHNGILPKEVQPTKSDRRCDTRVAAEDFLPHNTLGTFASSRGRRRLTRWLGPGNKIVILTVNPRYRDNAYILNEERGIWDGGVWYSNDDFRAPLGTWEWPPIAGFQPCAGCQGWDSIDGDTGRCRICGTCRDCGEPDGYCFCYAPAKMLI